MKISNAISSLRKNIILQRERVREILVKLEIENKDPYNYEIYKIKLYIDKAGGALLSGDVISMVVACENLESIK